MQIEKLTECVCKDIERTGCFYMNYEDVQKLSGRHGTSKASEK